MGLDRQGTQQRWQTLPQALQKTTQEIESPSEKEENQTKRVVRDRS